MSNSTMVEEAARPAEEDDEISLLDLLQVVVENLRLLVLGSLLVGLGALGIAFLITPVYTAKVQFLTPQQQQSAASALLASLSSMGPIGGAAAMAGLKNPADQYIALMKSETVQDSLIERFKLRDRYKKEFNEDARKALLNNTQFTGGKDGIIKLEVDDVDPAFAAEMANGYLDELRKLMGRLALTEAQTRRQFFERMLADTRSKLAEAELALRQGGISSGVLKITPTSAVELVARTRAAVTAQEIKIASMRGYLAESAPEIKQALLELATLKAQLAKFEQDDKASAGDSKYLDRYRDFRYQETLLEMFTKQYELARIDESREGINIQVVDSAKPPERKSKPKKALIAVIATLAAFFLLMLWVFVRQAWRRALEQPETAAKVGGIHAAWRRALGRA